MTGGLVVWAAHFTALYLLSSLADVVARADDLRWRLAGLALSAAALFVCACLIVWALSRRRPCPGLAHDLAAASGLIGGIAITWQSVPLVMGY